jgi:hypothetical protein
LHILANHENNPLKCIWIENMMILSPYACF